MRETVIDEWDEGSDRMRLVERNDGVFLVQRIYNGLDGIRRWEVVPVASEQVWGRYPHAEPYWHKSMRRQDERDRYIQKHWWRRLAAAFSVIYRLP